MKRIIIDCDPSADDALALMLALSSPELKIEGITAASGVCPAEESAENALKILALYKRTDIPVAVGAAQPLKRELIFDRLYSGADGMAETGLPGASIRPVSGSAAEFLYQKLSGSAEPVHIISIAPMTNLGELLAKHPEIKEKIASVITTSGSYGVAPDKRAWNARPSWNIYSDPEAAEIVFGSGVPVFAAGLDITTRLSDDMVGRIFEEGNQACPQYVFFKRAAEYNKRNGLHSYSLLVDAVAAAAAAEPSLVKYIKGKAAVCTADGLFRGQTLFGVKGHLDRHTSCVYAAYDFDYNGFIDRLLERVFA